MRLNTGAPEGFEHHTAIDSNTAHDLDLGSFYSTLSHNLTGFGTNRLMWRMTHPNLDADEIAKFQNTFRHLTKARAEWGDLRDLLRAASGDLSLLETAMNPAETDKFFKKAELSRRRRDIFYNLMVLYNGHLFLSGTLSGHLTAGTFIPGLVFGFLASSNMIQPQQLRKSILGVREVLNSAIKLKEILKASSDPYLHSLGEKLEARLQKDSPLENILRRSKYILSPTFAVPGDAIVGQALWTLKGLATDISANLNEVAEVLDVFAEVDYFTGLTLWIHEHQEHLVYPEVVRSEVPFIDLEEGHQAYIVSQSPQISVPNDFKANVNDDRFFILTGPNKAGKSTYVRSVSLLILAAEMALPVTAKRMRLSPLHVMTNMDISDSMTGGKSYYDAETDRLASIFGVLDSGIPTFFGLDEILLGTNSEERQAAEKSFIKYAAARRHLTVLALHDLAMAKVEGHIAGVRNIHLDERVEPDGSIVFPFKVKSGVTPHRNGLRLLGTKKFPREFLDDADLFFKEGQAKDSQKGRP